MDGAEELIITAFRGEESVRLNHQAPTRVLEVRCLSLVFFYPNDQAVLRAPLLVPEELIYSLVCGPNWRLSQILLCFYRIQCEPMGGNKGLPDCLPVPDRNSFNQARIE